MKSDSDSFFVDANVPVYADDPRNKAAKALLKDSGGGTLHISPQILAEFYSIITSAKRVTAPYAPLEAVEFMETLLEYEHVPVLPISEDVPARLLALLRTNQVRGPHVFDLPVVATMLAHGVTKLFPYNGSDFKQFPDVELFEPAHEEIPREGGGSPFEPGRHQYPGSTARAGPGAHAVPNSAALPAGKAD
jgi:predicted nucleic acid-binding protein